jgi:hypothetical protein
MVWRYPIAAVVLAASIAFSQSPADHEDLPANDLVRRVVDNELHHQDTTLWKYQEKSVHGGVVEVKDVVETKGGDLTHLLSRNGKPLTEDQAKSEEQGMERFIGSPEEQQKQRKAADADRRKTVELFGLLPKALIFEVAERNGNVVKLNFHPNPDFHPPSREAHVFHEMEGQLTVDGKELRVVEFAGHLLHEVRFGGFLGHLDQGGSFDVRQQEVGPGHWEVTLLKINMKGKALFFKSINVQQDEARSRFERMPDTLTLAKAAESLRKPEAN